MSAGVKLYQAKKLDTLRAAHYSMAAQRSYKKRHAMTSATRRKLPAA